VVIFLPVTYDTVYRTFKLYQNKALNAAQHRHGPASKSDTVCREQPEWQISPSLPANNTGIRLSQRPTTKM